MQDGWSPEKAAPWFTFSKKGSYHSCRISLILLHKCAKCLIAPPFPTSLGSWKAYRIWIQLIAAIVLHPHKALPCPLRDLQLSLFVKFIPYMNHAFSLHIDPATSLRGTRTRGMTNERDMPAEHAFSWLCDELKCSVDESGRMDDAKHIVS